MNDSVSLSIGVGEMTNKSPLESLMILALPPTFAPKRMKGLAIPHTCPGTISREIDLFSDIVVNPSAIEMNLTLLRSIECCTCVCAISLRKD